VRVEAEDVACWTPPLMPGGLVGWKGCRLDAGYTLTAGKLEALSRRALNDARSPTPTAGKLEAAF